MKLIVAVDACWAIGKDGDQLCYIPPDLKRFQRLTTGHPVLLGRKTLATFPGGRPLKNRRNLILSTDPAFAPAGGEVFATLKAALAAGEVGSDDKVWVKNPGKPDDIPTYAGICAETPDGELPREIYRVYSDDGEAPPGLR